MKIDTNSAFTEKMNSFPDDVKPIMKDLRDLIIETANELELDQIEETLKWGEPSFLTKNGSTLRMNWYTKDKTKYALFFKCTSKLVETIRAVYGDLFKYENNRAIIFDLEENIPNEAVKDCIAMALEYHKVKNLPLLGRSII